MTWTSSTEAKSFDVTWTDSASTDLFNVWFFDSMHGLACGTGGAILYTEDHGRSWARRVSHSSAALYGIAFADRETGVIAGASGTILVTTDSGATWTKVSSDTTQQLSAVAFADPRSVWIVGHKGTVKHSSDAGGKWSTVTDRAFSDVSLFNVAFSDAIHGIITGEHGFVATTIDGGQTWAASRLADAHAFYGVAVHDNLAVVVGVDSQPHASSDYGMHWTADNAPEIDGLTSVAFDEQTSRFIAAGLSGIIASREPSGWHVVAHRAAVASERLNAIRIDGHKATIVGDSETILTSENDGKNWTLISHAWYPSLYSAASDGSALVAAGRELILSSDDDGSTWRHFHINDVIIRVIVDAHHHFHALGVFGKLYDNAPGSDTWTESPVVLPWNTSDFAISRDRLWITTRDGSINSYSASGALASHAEMGAPLLSLCFSDVDHGAALATNGSLLVSSTGGSSWDHLSAPPHSDDSVLNAIACSPGASARLWIGSSDGTVYMSVNHGKDWTSKKIGSKAVLALAAMDDINVWAVGAVGSVFHTADGGNQWKSLDNNVAASFRGVTALDGRRALAVGGFGIMNTFDLTGEYSDVSPDLLSADYSEAGHVWIGGSTGLLLESRDGGATFLPSRLPTNEKITDLKFSSSLLGWALTNERNLFKTADGGAHWRLVQTNDKFQSLVVARGGGGFIVGDRQAFRLHSDDGDASPIQGDEIAKHHWTTGSIWDVNHGLLASDDGTVILTQDGGANWKLGQQLDATLRAVSIIDSGFGFATGDNGAAFVTKDGGWRWERINVETTDSLGPIVVASSCCGWMLGENGNIYDTSDSGLTWHVQNVSHTRNPIAIAVWKSEGSIMEGIVVGGDSLIVRSDQPRYAPQVTNATLANSGNLEDLYFEFGGIPGARVSLTDVSYRKWNAGAWISIDGTATKTAHGMHYSWNPGARPHDVATGTLLSYRVTATADGLTGATDILKAHTYMPWWPRQPKFVRALIIGGATLTLYVACLLSLLRLWPIGLLYTARIVTVVDKIPNALFAVKLPLKVALHITLGPTLARSARVRAAWIARRGEDAILLSALADGMQVEYLRHDDVLNMYATILSSRAEAELLANRVVECRSTYAPVYVECGQRDVVEISDAQAVTAACRGKARIVLVGAGGVGKSTLAFHMAKWLLRSGPSWWDEPCLAVLMEPGTNTKGPLDHINAALKRWLSFSARPIETDEKTIASITAALITSGRIVALFDSISEWSTEDRRGAVAFLVEHPNCRSVLTSRSSVECNGIEIRVIGCALSTLVRLIEMHAPRREESEEDEFEYNARIMKTASIVTEFMRRTSARHVNPLLVKLFSCTPSVQGEQLQCVGDVVMNYVVSLWPPTLEPIVRECAMRLGELAVSGNFRPHEFKRKEAMEALGQRFTIGTTDVLEMFVNAGVLHRRESLGITYLRFDLDPVAEHLAALGWVSSDKVGEMMTQIDAVRSRDGEAQVDGVLAALRDVMMVRRARHMQLELGL